MGKLSCHEQNIHPHWPQRRRGSLLSPVTDHVGPHASLTDHVHTWLIACIREIHELAISTMGRFVQNLKRRTYITWSTTQRGVWLSCARDGVSTDLGLRCGEQHICRSGVAPNYIVISMRCFVLWYSAGEDLCALSDLILEI